MTQTRPHEVRRLSIRVALAATALVAAIYLAIAIAVVVFVSADLTRQIDNGLARALEGVPNDQLPEEGPFEPPQGERRFGPVILAWSIESDGTVRRDASTPDLPAAFRRIGAPQTVTIDGTEMRLAGAASGGDDYVVVGQTLDQVSQTRSTLIAGELLIAPILMVAVFLGAVTIGRRVATPIELARQRQLDFTADASHELRTPLSVIEAHTSLALAHDRPAAWYQSAFERIDHESKRMRRLLDDLLWLARFDATHAPPHAEPVDLSTMAAQATDRFGPIAEPRGLRITLRAAEGGTVIAVPPDWLDRLLGVLLDNACKYAPDGGSVEVSVASETSRVRLTVDDSGPGIPEAERGRIFDRFHRAVEGPGGAGLGLAIADAIVRATGGQWQVGASPAGGARMSVSWPPVLTGRREPEARHGLAPGDQGPSAA